MASEFESFDERAYLALNPDVAIAVKNGVFKSGRAHWEAHGRYEDRLWSVPSDSAGFDEIQYLVRHPDVLAAVRRSEFRSGYEHWVKAGKSEGRIGRHLTPGNEQYLYHNPDVASAVAGGTFVSGHEHWQRCGRFEFRQGTPRAWRGSTKQHVDHNLPLGVNHFGYHGSASGLGNAAAGYASAVAAMGLSVQRIQTPDWADPDATNAIDASSSAMYRINFIQQNVDVMSRWGSRYGGSALNGRYNIALWVWELHAAYAPAHIASRMVNEVWAPSQYVVSAFKNVSAAPVHCIPYVVEPVVPRTGRGREHFGLRNDSFVFLYTFDMSSGFDRKNPLALLHAFRLAFASDPTVLLVLKYTRPEHDPASTRILEHAAAACSNVRTMSATVSDGELQQLLLCADCFVSPHRSEGFGLNVAAALYHGIPVIATGYSGTLDFAHEETALLIDYTLASVGPGNQPYHPDYVWADPDPDHMAELIRQVRWNPERAREKAAFGSRALKANNSRTAIGTMMRERLHSAGILAT